MRRILPCAILGLAVLSLAVAQVADSTRTESPQDFVFKASAAGLAEVNLGSLGVSNASAIDVKKFAEMMVEDHTKANKELLALGDKKRLQAAPRMDGEHERAAAALAQLKGGAFDREFMAGMVKDHKEAVALFERQAKDGKDEDIKSWADKTLPTLRHHLEMAQDISGRLKDVSGKDDKDRPKDARDKDTTKDDKDRVKDRPKDTKDKDLFKDDKDRPKDNKDLFKDDKDRPKDRPKDAKDKDFFKDDKDRPKDRPKDDKVLKDDKALPIERKQDR